MMYNAEHEEFVPWKPWYLRFPPAAANQVKSLPVCVPVLTLFVCLFVCMFVCMLRVLPPCQPFIFFYFIVLSCLGLRG